MMTNGAENETTPAAAMTIASRESTFDSYKRGLEPTGIDAAMRLATALAKTNYGGVSEPEQVLAKMMFGRELGLTVMNSLRSVYVVNGRPGLDANVMHALCLQSPICEYFDMVDTTSKKATYRAKRRGRPEVVLSWTIEQAGDAGLLGGRADLKNKGQTTEPKDNWRNYPENMLRARCIANLARICFPEAINGMHTPEELENSTVPIPDATPVAPSAAMLQSAQEAQAKHGAAAGVLKGRVLAAQTADEKKELRAELARLKASGELPEPWLSEVVTAYNDRFAKKTAPVDAHAAITAAAVREASKAAPVPTEPPLPTTDATEPATPAPEPKGEDGWEAGRM